MSYVAKDTFTSMCYWFQGHLPQLTPLPADLAWVKELNFICTYCFSSQPNKISDYWCQIFQLRLLRSMSSFIIIQVLLQDHCRTLLKKLIYIWSYFCWLEHCVSLQCIHAELLFQLPSATSLPTLNLFWNWEVQLS